MSSGALLAWLQPLDTSEATVRRLYELQAPTFDCLRRQSTRLPANFVDLAMAYAVRGSTFCRRMVEPNAAIDTLPFRVSNYDLLQEEVRGGRSALVLLSHTGMWNSLALWAATAELPLVLVIEQMPDHLVDFYRRHGCELIVARPPILLKLASGRTVRLPGTDTLALVKESLARGKVVLMFADAYRRNGLKARLLGMEVRIIQHYAVVAVQTERPVFVLRHWTTDDDLHLDFARLDTGAGAAKKSARAASIVRQYVATLDEHLADRPEQFAYIPPNIFCLSATGDHRGALTTADASTP